jgi:hypothetical protein
MRPFHVSSTEGRLIVSVDDAGMIYVAAGMEVAELANYCMNAMSQQRDKLVELNQLVTMLQSNRWQDAVLSGAEVYDALSPSARKCISTRMVSQVLDAVAVVAKKSVN